MQFYNVDGIRIAPDQLVPVSILNYEELGKTVPPPHGKFILCCKRPDDTHALVAANDPDGFIYQLTNHHEMDKSDAYRVLGTAVAFIEDPARETQNPENEELIQEFAKKSKTLLRLSADNLNKQICDEVANKKTSILDHDPTDSIYSNGDHDKVSKKDRFLYLLIPVFIVIDVIVLPFTKLKATIVRNKRR